ncbi:macro domain-containing protein [Candidatus Micrarchaeota archaeon]|nr:macro domain-containing protein [Candidatus Micrarchaeota archaeon]
MSATVLQLPAQKKEIRLDLRPPWKVKAGMVAHACNPWLRTPLREGSALFNAGGQELKRGVEVALGMMKNMGYKGYPLGSSISTIAGKLPSSYVAHVVCLNMDSPPTTEPTNLDRGILNTMRIAEKRKLKSVAFSLLAGECGAMDELESVRRILSISAVFLRTSDNVFKAIICVPEALFEKAFLVLETAKAIFEANDFVYCQKDKD